jgi:glycosyltransferase involved in cell wall biosynthesis
MRTSLIIPALNEAKCLSSLLAEVPMDIIDQLIVVDNGSTDNTSQVAREAGAVVIFEPLRGYGYACKAGSTVAKGDVLVFMDGDGSFVPSEITVLLEPLAQGTADLILGSRKLHDTEKLAMPAHQRIGNRLVAWLLRQRYGLKLSDLGPFRAIRRELLLGLDMQEHTYGWPLEMIIKTLNKEKKIVEVPITFRPRLAGRSKVSGTLQGTLLTAYRYFRVMFRYAYR